MVDTSSAPARRWRTGMALALALCAGMVVVAVTNGEISRFSSDSFHYVLLGDALAHGRGFVSGGSQHPDVTRAPLLPLLMAPFILLTGNPVQSAVLVVNLAAAALVLPLFLLCRGLFGPRTAFAALPLSAVSCVLGSADRVLPTSLHLLGFVSTAALLVRAMEEGTPRAHVWVGIAGGLTALARPEGLPFLLLPLAWALAGPSPSLAPGPPRPRRTRALGAVSVALGAAVVLVPYVAWTSGRLHRFALLPSVQYVNDTRYVADRFGLREMRPFVPWEERALFLLTADREDRVLDVYFRTRAMPPADPAETHVARATAGPENPAKPGDLLARRLNIALENLRRIPARMRNAHLLPAVPFLLGFAGVVALLARRGGWRPLAFTGALFGFGLLPVLTNLEARFLYVPFAAGLAVAAAGWAAIDRGARRLLPAVARYALHGALLLGLTAAGLTHRMTESPKLDLEIAQRALAARAPALLPPGPILAVRPHFPFWAGRPYAPLPILGPQEVVAYARRHGVEALVLQVPFDVKNRPQLAGLATASPPPGLVRLDREPIAGGGEMLLFRVESDGAGTGREP